MMENMDAAYMEELRDLANLMKSNGGVEYMMGVLFEHDGEPSSEVHYDYLAVMEKAREIGIKPSDARLLKRLCSSSNP